jgi:hypothetical protein
MPAKRKQQDIEVTTPSRLKRTKHNPATTKRKGAEETTSDSFTSSAAKKTKPTPRSTGTAQGTQCPTNRRSKKTRPNNPLTRSRLVPRGERKSAKIGHKDETMLRLLCNDSKSGGMKELHFRNMLHSNIDWNDAEHINKINNWRNQIYGRAGIKSKVVTTWLPDEELWFELYYHLSIAESRTRGILLPKTLQVLQAFNQTFVGQILQDSHGKSMEPRVERHSNAFASKSNRMCPQLRERLNQCVFGKSGDVFVPVITMKMLRTYKQMKTGMEKKGIEKESAYAENLEVWQYLFSHLPSSNDVDVQDDPVTSVEDDAAAVLISMAAQSVNAHNPIKIEGEEHVPSKLLRLTNYENLEDMRDPATPFIFPTQRTLVPTWSALPELSYTPSFTTSQRSDLLTTPGKSPIVSHSNIEFCHGLSKPSCCASPSCWLDISTLIASPD